MSALCIACGIVVDGRRHAVSCDVCDRWHHRLCGTGISQTDYFAARREEIQLKFVCQPCTMKIPARDSEAIEVALEAIETFLEETADVGECSTRDVDAAKFTLETPSDLSLQSSVTGASISTASVSEGDMDITTVDDSGDGDVTTRTVMGASISTTLVSEGDMDITTVDDSGDRDSSTRTVNVTVEIDRSFVEPEIVHERSITDQPPPETAVADRPTTYEIIQKGSQLGHDLLVDSQGFSYVRKERRPRSTAWRCSVRSTRLTCTAGVIEKDGSFRPNSKEHIHPPVPERELKAKVTAKAKAIAANDTARSAKAIVAEAKEGVDTIVGVGELRQDYVARVVNRFRQDLRPEEPEDLDFVLNEDAIPKDFYRREVKVDGKRHLIFATDHQLDILTTARRWYIDGTFKVMRAPFTMLLSIPAFVRRGDCSKQVPLMFIAMTGRTATDYEKVFKAVRRGLGDQQEVEEIVCDYEAALWKAVRKTFPTVRVKGCSFHWGQAVWRHVQSAGLATEYMQDRGTHALVRMLPCLPFFPAEHIVETFEALEDFNTADHLQPLFNYIRRTWLQSSVWPVDAWCIFGQSIRTNNDVEGWHRRLNIKAGVAPPFYSLVKYLHQEATEIEGQVRLVSEMKLRRIQRLSFRKMQARIFDAWDSYRQKELSATSLLKI